VFVWRWVRSLLRRDGITLWPPKGGGEWRIDICFVMLSAAKHLFFAFLCIVMISTQTPIRFAIIGCGRIAQRHAQHIAARGELVAVCDIVPEKANALAATYGATLFTHFMDMLDGSIAIDVVAVCSPNGLHAQHSIAALKAGCHVLVEKPMAISVADCQAMIDAAVAADRKLLCVKQNRYNPPVVAVKQLLDEGRLGKIYSVQLNCFWNRNADYYANSWKGTKAMDGGTLFTQFSHFIDLLYWLLGDIVAVQAIMKNVAHQGVIEFEDTGIINLAFASGAIGGIHYTVNSYQQNMEGSLTLFGEKGTVKIGGQYLNELEYQHIADYVIPDLPKGNPANAYGTYQGSMSNHDKVYDNLVAVLRENAPIATDGWEAMQTVRIIADIYRSGKLS